MYNSGLFISFKWPNEARTNINEWSFTFLDSCNFKDSPGDTRAAEAYARLTIRNALYIWDSAGIIHVLKCWKLIQSHIQVKDKRGLHMPYG